MQKKVYYVKIVKTGEVKQWTGAQIEGRQFEKDFDDKFKVLGEVTAVKDATLVAMPNAKEKTEIEKREQLSKKNKNELYELLRNKQIFFNDKLTTKKQAVELLLNEG